MFFAQYPALLRRKVSGKPENIVFQDKLFPLGWKMELTRS